GDFVSVGPDGQHGARLDRVSVQLHRARPAVGRIARPVRPRQPQVVPQEVDQEQARLDVGLARLTVDVDAYAHYAPPPARSTAFSSARATRTLTRSRLYS